MLRTVEPNMKALARGAAEFARQLALEFAVVQASVVAPVPESTGADEVWAMVLVPYQIEKICEAGSIERLAILLRGLRSCGYRIVVLASAPLPPALAAASDRTHEVETHLASDSPARTADRLARNASVRYAGVSLGQMLRPRFVLQYGSPFLDAGADVSFYCNVPLVLYWNSSDYGNRVLSPTEGPLARVANSMERNVISRSSVVLTTSIRDRIAVITRGAASDRVLVLRPGDESTTGERWASDVLDLLKTPGLAQPAGATRAGATPEDVNGHSKRLAWIKCHLDESPAVEFGCGTGVMVTIPLLEAGYDVRGVDLDHESIELGRKLLRERGLDPDRLMACDLASLQDCPNTIIASEVLEHIPDAELDQIVALLYRMLPPSGRLLVTVPNGYGGCELESALWFKLGVGRILQKLRIVRGVKALKRMFGVLPSNALPSTLADSPHVQRFTKRSIVQLLERHGFRIDEVQGSVLMCGPFTVLMMEGFSFFPRLNARVGEAVPTLAAGFFVACTRPPSGQEGECRHLPPMSHGRSRTSSGPEGR